MVQVYTGDGKGKTTAALGLAMRAAGHGMRTLFIQFMKGLKCGEHVSAMLLPSLIEIEQFGREEFYSPDAEKVMENLRLENMGREPGTRISSDRKLFVSDARKGLARAEAAFESGEYDIIVLDEVLNLVRLGIMDEDELISLVGRYRDSGAEIVLTGRGARELKVTEMADIVTEMKMVRYTSGFSARMGIDY